MSKSMLLVGSALGALAFAGAAIAQPANTQAQQTAPPAAPVEASGSASGSAIEVGGVVITAERRSVNVQDIPVAVTAITSAMRDQLGIQTIADVTNFTPGFSYNTQSDRSSIRGISRFFNNQAAQGSVAIYSDGAYTSSTFELGKATIFTDRVEVLRGPQGTLYGRNAIGGAINIISRRPTDDWYAEVRGSAGNFNAQEYSAAVSGPIGDNLRFRLAASRDLQGEGYYHNAFPNNGGYSSEGLRRDEYYVEAQLEFNLGESFEAWGKIGYREWNNQNGGPGNRAGPALYPFWNGNAPAGSIIPGGINPVTGAAGCTVASATCVVGPGTGASATGLSSPLIPSLEYGTTEVNPACPTYTLSSNQPGVPAVYRCSGGDPRSFATNTPGHITLDNAPVATLELTYHGSGFDVRYVGGYARYKYGLDFDLDGTANNGSYIFPGTSVTCTAVGAPLPNCTGAGATTPGVQIFNTGSGHYEEDKEWNSHEVTISSTGDGNFNWIVGAYWYHDNNSYTPLTNVSLPQQAQLDQPLLSYDLCAGVAIPDPANPGQFLALGIHSPVLSTNAVPVAACAGATPGSSLPQGFVVNRVNAAPNPRRIYAYNHFDGGTESYAGFGQASWDFRSDMTLTVGLRYSHDETDVVESARYVCFASALCSGSATALNSLPGNASFSYDVTPLVISTSLTTDPSIVPGSLTVGADGNWHRRLLNDWSAWTGVAKLEWRPTDDTLVYASYTRGFKAGGFNAGSISAVPSAGPESVDAYEIGLKRNWGRVFQFNASIFYYNYYDPQAPLSVIPPSGVRRTDFINIPQTRNLGLEVESIWSPVPDLQILINYALLDARITDTGCGYVDPNDPLALLPEARPISGTFPGCTAAPATARPQDLRGSTMPASPLNRITLNANYTFHFDPGNLTLSATWAYRSATYFDIFNREYAKAPAWGQTDLRMTFAGRDNRYSVIVYGRNIFDELGYEGNAAAGSQISSNTTGGAIGESPVLTPPRTYGIELQYRFF